MRSLTISLVVILTLGGCGREASGPSSQARQDSGMRHNVVLIVSDALCYDLLGCNGGPARTPNIDRLAAAGVRFTQARSAAPWTMPSAVAMVTGEHASAFPAVADSTVEGRLNYHVSSAVTTLPMVLQDLGYNLVFSGYNPNAWLAGNFRDFTRVEPLHPHGYVSDTPPDSLAALTTLVPLDYRSLLHRRMIGMLEFLRNAPPETPFFAVNWFDDPHAPYDPEPRFAKPYPPRVRQLARKPRYYKNQLNMHLFDHFEKASLDPVEVDYFRNLYRAEVESMDERVGLILALLDKRSLRENTIIVFTSDHGEGFNEHGRSYYEELLHVPLIISGPGVPADVVVDDTVSLVDLMGTLRNLLGVEGMEGYALQDFADTWSGEKKTVRPFYFDAASNLAGNDCRDAVLDGPFKLIVHNTGDRVELYDLQLDPGEQTDLVATDTTRVAYLQRLLVEFRRRIAQQKTLNSAGAVPGDSLSAAEREDVLKKLRSLGYVN